MVAGSHGRVDWMTMSAPVIARASRVSTPVTWSMIDRIAAMAPTPMAMQTKKKISRRHAPRSSRPTMRRTKPMAASRAPGRATNTGAGTDAAGTTRPSRSDSWTSARAASAASCVTSTSVVPRRACTSNSRSMTCWPLVESRLPVGSSAMITAGSFESARATATRCCSPPESCDG